MRKWNSLTNDDQIDVALILSLPLSSSTVKTTRWSSFNMLQGSNSAESTSTKGFHIFLLIRLVKPFSSNDISSDGSPLVWKWPRVKYLYSRSEWTLGFQLKPRRICVAPLLVTSCNRSGRPVNSSGRPFRVWRSTVSSATVDRFTEVWLEELLGLEQSTVNSTSSRPLVCPVDFSFLHSAVDHSQHGGRPFPYFSATLTSTND